MFFDKPDFYDFRDRCKMAGLYVLIIAGIMPITQKKGMARMSEPALGARFPAKLLRAMKCSADTKAEERIGIAWATEQVLDLFDHPV